MDRKEVQGWQDRVEKMCNRIEAMREEWRKGKWILFSAPEGHFANAVEAYLFERGWAFKTADRSGVYLISKGVELRIFSPLHGWGPLIPVDKEQLMWE